MKLNNKKNCSKVKIKQNNKSEKHMNNKENEYNEKFEIGLENLQKVCNNIKEEEEEEENMRLFKLKMKLELGGEWFDFTLPDNEEKISETFVEEESKIYKTIKDLDK
jgi:hypothetical protein